MDVCLLWEFLSGRGLCDELITCSEESYRLWCVEVHVHLQAVQYTHTVQVKYEAKHWQRITCTVEKLYVILFKYSFITTRWWILRDPKHVEAFLIYVKQTQILN
jgi:hypothetical protein